jgi:hypothetical protein
MSTFKTPSRRVVMSKTINSVARLIKQVTDRHSFSQTAISDSAHRDLAAMPVIAAVREKCNRPNYRIITYVFDLARKNSTPQRT